MTARLRRPRTFAILAWLAAFVVSASATGLPTKRASVLIWIALAVLAIGVERPRATLRSFVTTWLPLFGALAAYDLLRGASDDAAQSAAHTWPHLDIDLWLGGGRTPSELLQSALWTPGDPSWWDYAAWGVYQSHFFAPLLLAVGLWGLRHRLATPYIIGLAVLSWMALATYALYPAQPPWMTARDGLTGPIDRVVQQMWQDVGIDRAARAFTTERSTGSKYSNPVAALPSLHAAFPMLIAVVLWGTRRWLDVVLAAYVAAMGLTLVYAGEHFTFDLALGWAYALAVGLVVRRYSPSKPGTSMPGSSNGSSGALPSPHSLDDGAGGGGVPSSAEASRSRYTSLPQTEDTRS